MVSSVPAVIDGLVAALKLAVPDVQIVDGQPIRADADVICIGFTGLPGEAAVTSNRTREQLAAEPNRERFDQRIRRSPVRPAGWSSRV